MQSYGAENTTENANRVREFGAANPDVLERRAMGMRGSGIDDNSDLLDYLLDKPRAQTGGTSPGTVEVGAPEVQQAMPTVQAASTPTRKSATAAPAPAPAMGPNLPMASGVVNPLDSPTRPTASRESSVWDWLLPVLIGVGGLGAADHYMKRKKPSSPSDATTLTPDPVSTPPNAAKMKAQPRAIGEDGKLLDNPYPDGQKRLTYEPKLSDESGKKMPSGAPELDKKGVNKEVDKMMKPEIDAENAQNNALMEQIRKRAADEAATADLVKKAKRAVGRK
jgi:hypothetical protein